MPTYDEKKIKDMVRSILPSTKRKWAREAKAEENGRGRSRVRRSLVEISKDLDRADDVDFKENLTRIAIHRVKRERRDSDKVSPLLRWAPIVTSGEPDERLAQIGKMMPKNTIGRHAIVHLGFMKEFDPEADARAARWELYDARLFKERQKADKANSDERRARLLRLVIETNGMQKLLNDLMKSTHHTKWVWIPNPNFKPNDPIDAINTQTISRPVGPRAPRVLKGIGDIESFVNDLHAASIWPYVKGMSAQEVENSGLHHPEWLRTLDEFLNVFEGCRFDPSSVKNSLTRELTRRLFRW